MQQTTYANCTSLAKIRLDDQQQKSTWVQAAHMNRL